MTGELTRDDGIYEAVLSAAERVLETMFFDSLCGEPAEAEPEAGLAYAAVEFRGSLAGRFEMALGANADVTLTANFLGLENAPAAKEVESTVAELANMCCGAFLSRVEPRGYFEIDPPIVGRLDELAKKKSWIMLPIEAGALYWRLDWRPAGSTGRW